MSLTIKIESIEDDMLPREVIFDHLKMKIPRNCKSKIGPSIYLKKIPEEIIVTDVRCRTNCPIKCRLKKITSL